MHKFATKQRIKKGAVSGGQAALASASKHFSFAAILILLLVSYCRAAGAWDIQKCFPVWVTVGWILFLFIRT
jgi:hypothetical protein